MREIPCEVVQDLMPSYLDQLTSEVTNQIVEEHVEGCQSCREMLDQMRKGQENGGQNKEERERDQKELDFLKKNRKRNRRVVLFCGAAAALLAALVLFIRLFLVGDRVYEDAMTFHALVNGEEMTLEAGMIDNNRGILDVNFEENEGVVTVSARAGLLCPFTKPRYSGTFTAKEQIREVRYGNRILWSDGEEISSLASTLYETRHPYMGDMPANAETAQVLGLYSYLGPYENELKSSEAPLTWIIRGTEEVPFSEEQMAAKEADLKSFGTLILAVVGNLDEVHFEYRISGEEKTLIVTAEEASAFFGQNIKDCGENIRLLDQLIHKTGLPYLLYGVSQEAAEGYILQIVNQTGEDLTDIGVNFYHKGNLRHSSGTCHADGSPLANGDSVELILEPQDLAEDPGEEEWELELALGFPDGSSKTIPERFRIQGIVWGKDTILVTKNADGSYSAVR